MRFIQGFAACSWLHLICGTTPDEAVRNIGEWMPMMPTPAIGLILLLTALGIPAWLILSLVFRFRSTPQHPGEAR